LILSFYDKVEVGTTLTIGPNSDNLYEDVTVTGTIDANTFGLDFFIQNDYDQNTPVYFSKNMFLINKYAYKRADAGALYKIKLPQKEITEIVEDLDFVNTTASCFYHDDNEGYLLASLGTNLRFINIVTLTVDKTMTTDNISANNIETYQIYALQVENDTLFRLQRKATYYGYSYTFTTANFQVSTIRPFVDSISVDVYPKIIPSNGVNVAEVKAIVKDQFAHPIVFKPVRFGDSDSVGYMTISDTYTDLVGKAISYYKAGLTPQSVTILVTMTQYD